MWFDLTTPPDPVELADIRDRDGITAPWMIDLLASLAVADLVEAHGAFREPLLELTRTAGVPEGTETMLTALRDRPGPARWSALERLSLALHGARLASFPLDVDLPDPEDLPAPLLATARSRVQQGLTVAPWSWAPHASPTIADEMARWFAGDVDDARAEMFKASIAQGDPDTCEAYVDEVRARAAALRHLGTGEWRWTLADASERLEVGRVPLPAAGTDLVVYRYGDSSVRIGRGTEEPVVLRQDQEVLEDYRGRLDVVGDGSPSNLVVTVTDSDPLVLLGGGVRLLRGALDDAQSVDVAVITRIAEGFLDGPMDDVLQAWRAGETDEGTRHRILLTVQIRVMLEACSFLSSDHMNALCGTFADADEDGDEWQAEADLLGRIDERHRPHRDALAWLTHDQWRQLEKLLPGEADPETWWGWRAQLDKDLSAVFSVLRELAGGSEIDRPDVEWTRQEVVAAIRNFDSLVHSLRNQKRGAPMPIVITDVRPALLVNGLVQALDDFGLAAAAHSQERLDADTQTIVFAVEPTGDEDGLAEARRISRKTGRGVLYVTTKRPAVLVDVRGKRSYTRDRNTVDLFDAPASARQEDSDIHRHRRKQRSIT